MPGITSCLFHNLCTFQHETDVWFSFSIYFILFGIVQYLSRLKRGTNFRESPWIISILMSICSQSCRFLQVGMTYEYFECLAWKFLILRYFFPEERRNCLSSFYCSLNKSALKTFKIHCIWTIHSRIYFKIILYNINRAFSRTKTNVMNMRCH